MIRSVILGSGRGSNAKALLQAQHNGQLGLAEINAVFSDNPNAGILSLGPVFEVASFYLNPGPFKTKLEGEAEEHWIHSLSALMPDLVILAGFMRVIKKPFLKAFPRVINLHPSLLPKYPGLNAIRRSLEAGDKETGCTVHWVTEEVDAGKIIAQSTVPIQPQDTLESLTERVHEAEHRLIVTAVRNVARDLFAQNLSRPGIRD